MFLSFLLFISIMVTVKEYNPPKQKLFEISTFYKNIKES